MKEKRERKRREKRKRQKECVNLLQRHFPVVRESFFLVLSSLPSLPLFVFGFFLSFLFLVLNLFVFRTFERSSKSPREIVFWLKQVCNKPIEVVKKRKKAEKIEENVNKCDMTEKKKGKKSKAERKKKNKKENKEEKKRKAERRERKTNFLLRLDGVLKNIKESFHLILEHH